MKISISHISLITLFTFLSFSCEHFNKQSKKPNVLIVVTDDQGWGDIGFNGNKIIETPVLDSIAINSVIFDRFYVSPESALTRESILSGKYSLNGFEPGINHSVKGEKYKTLSEIFKENGYQTACIGKWNLSSKDFSEPQDFGFDLFFGFKGDNLDENFNANLEHNGETIKTTGYISDVLTDTLINFITKTEKPFFSYLSFNIPHVPYQLPEKYYEKYLQKGLDSKTASVYGMCESVDFNFKKIIESLSKSGKLDNTIIVFMGDNGPDFIRFNGGLKGWKKQVDEGGVRVPFFIAYNDGDFPKRRISKTFAAHIDLYPTLLELCNINGESYQSDGISFLRLMALPSIQLPDRKFYTYYRSESNGALGAVRTKNYLLTITSSDTSLYNLEKDPFQKKNLISKEEGIAKNLIEDYRLWLKQYQAGNVILTSMDKINSTQKSIK